MKRLLHTAGFVLTLDLCWLFATGSIGWGNAAVGFAVGVGALAVGGESPEEGERSGRFSGRALFRLLAIVPLRIVQSNFELVREVLRPRLSLRPAIVEVPLEIRGGYPTLLLANLVTLTPGSLSLAIDEQAHRLFVHTFTGEDPAETVRQIKRDFEAPLIGLFGK